MGVVAAVLLGPAGFALVGSTMAGIIGGAVGGAISGGLNGGWKGALIGGALGGALGGVGAWGVSTYGAGFGVGMLAAGAGVAGATNSWDSFAGGLVGGVAGAFAGQGIISANSQQFGNFRAGNGFVSNATLAARRAALAAQQTNTATPTGIYGKFTMSVEQGGGSTGMGGSGGGWGHSWTTVEGGGQGPVSRGFWPGAPAGKEAVWGTKYPGVLTKGAGFLDGVPRVDVAATWAINETQYANLMSYTANFEASQNTWSLSVNCTDFTVGAARSIGINVPNVKTAGYEDPNKLAAWIKSQD